MKCFKELSEAELSLIADEFQRIKKCTYLDHAGATLYSEKQVENAYELLKTNLFCNPHTSRETENVIDSVRNKILELFNTDTSEYSVVFTSGATASLKIVAECFDFNDTGYFVYVQENHTSVLGMREIVNTKHIQPITRIQLLEILDAKKHLIDDTNTGNSLITFPAQCNFSGYKYPLQIISKIQQTSSSSFVCLDAAAFVGTNFLDLNKYRPDFVTISFYKIFGYPTGLGALLVSNRGQNMLNKKYFGGGTVKIAMSMRNFHVKHDCFHQHFEDGTISFLSISNLLSGFSTIERLIPSTTINSMQRISNHVFELATYAYNQLKSLKYNELKPLVKIYAHTDYSAIHSQGGIITFNLLHKDGSYIGFAEVALLASIYDIYLRTGCFCNPGACQVFLDLQDDDIKEQYQAGHICGDYNDLVNGIPTGAIRISFGYMSTKNDVDNLMKMLTECYLKNDNNRSKLINDSSKISKFLGNFEIKPTKEDRSIRLRSICIYPIKSCGAFKIKTKWELTKSGLKYDRYWMIVNASGVAVTQKTNTKLCMIMPIIDEAHDQLRLNYPGFKSISISLNTLNGNIISSSLCKSKVCGDLVEGIDCGNDVANWLNEVLSTQGLRLIRLREDSSRKNQAGQVKNINLSNQAQFLLINYTSVLWLASKIDWPDNLDDNIENIIDRFRGNFIIETLEPLEENQVDQINFGNIKCKVDGPCTRCQMICIDPKTGQKTSEPLRTITKEFQGKIRFGIYLSQLHETKENLNEKIVSCYDDITIKTK